MKKPLAMLTATILSLGLTACGGDDSDDRADDGLAVSVTTGPEDVAQDFDGFTTPRERDAALTTYACIRMESEPAGDVTRAAYDTVINDDILTSSFFLDPEDKKQAASDSLTATLSQYDTSNKNKWENTCDESSPYYRSWIKVGYSQYLDQEMTFTKAVADAVGAAEGVQYARELSGEARGLLNP